MFNINSDLVEIKNVSSRLRSKTIIILRQVITYNCIRIQCGSDSTQSICSQSGSISNHSCYKHFVRVASRLNSFSLFFLLCDALPMFICVAETDTGQKRCCPFRAQFDSDRYHVDGQSVCIQASSILVGLRTFLDSICFFSNHINITFK